MNVYLCCIHVHHPHNAIVLKHFVVCSILRWAKRCVVMVAEASVRALGYYYRIHIYGHSHSQTTACDGWLSFQAFYRARRAINSIGSGGGATAAAAAGVFET
jgi:hypothetical protein